MAISDSQKIDLLLKKLGYGVSKTDLVSIKSPSNESIASPLLIRGDQIWVNADQITATPPANSSDIIAVKTGTTSVQCVSDTTSSTNRTWKTNTIDWIPSEFGPGYQVRVWTAPAGTSNPTTSGTRLYPDGSGNSDSWYFDYQSGVLNFPDTNIPSSVSGNVVFVEGYQYIGLKGITAATDQGFVDKGEDPGNWDTNTLFGVFGVNRVSWSGTIGAPTDAYHVGLLTVLVSSGVYIQKYQPNDTASLQGAEFFRTKTEGGNWSPWARVVSNMGLLDGGNF